MDKNGVRSGLLWTNEPDRMAIFTSELIWTEEQWKPPGAQLSPQLFELLAGILNISISEPGSFPIRTYGELLGKSKILQQWTSSDKLIAISLLSN
jgi:hypothetical protein